MRSGTVEIEKLFTCPGIFGAGIKENEYQIRVQIKIKSVHSKVLIGNLRETHGG